MPYSIPQASRIQSAQLPRLMLSPEAQRAAGQPPSPPGGGGGVMQLFPPGGSDDSPQSTESAAAGAACSRLIDVWYTCSHGIVAVG